MNINFNEINSRTIQIYGSVNGFANKVYFQGRDVWRYDITFFTGQKERVSQWNSDKDGTLNTIEKLKDRIIEIYKKDL